ncbi:hypothetical protein SAMN04488026_105120 [Aliiruegeria lutimaris]|uniref:Uncharacterized protein n=1 Tax=Aliiruegeria lutimaris TaxID=571298 RepID=A0A1G9E9P7_9RHOB|nr:hypothetical protein SAMN04488026_105120 [Aliiruegeria lutimaris]
MKPRKRPNPQQAKPAQLPDDFVPGTYLLLNPDFAAAGVDPAEHFSNFGIHEGRSYSAAYAQDGPLGGPFCKVPCRN